MQAQPTEQEISWANDIKRKAQAAGLDLVSDFEFLQHAIIAKEKSDKAVQRMRGMQKFREHYKINNIEADDPLQLIQDFDRKFSSFVSCISSTSDGTQVMLAEYRKFDPKALKTDDDWRHMMVAFYYMLVALQSDLEAVRRGIVFEADCFGMGWNNFSFEAEKRAAELYQDSYPIRMEAVVMLDAPNIINAMIAIVKVFLSQKIRDLIVVESSADYYQDKQYPTCLMPKRLGGAGGAEQTVSFLAEKLQVRLQSEKSYQLPSPRE